MDLPTKPATRARYDAATAKIEAYVIVDSDGRPYGRLVIRTRATSRGHTARAFFHVFGHAMWEGVANGGGYDMSGAATASAMLKAWPTLHIPDKAKLKPMVVGLEGGGVQTCASRCIGLTFYRAI